MATGTTRPRVAIIGTGGTISSVGRDNLDIATYMDTKKKYEVDELLAQFPEVATFAELLPVRFRAVGSTAIGPKDWLDLNRLIHDTAAENPDLAGIVVTHGTATLEETAYFLNLTVKLDIPVVLVGAQRPASGLSTDAALNLVNAVRTASAPESRGLGTLVVLNDEIQAAREVVKTSTLRLQTFRTPDFGILGHADADRIAYYRRPMRRHAPDTEFDVSGLSDLPRVDIVFTYAGVDGTAVDAFADAGAKGIVVAGMLPGFSNADQLAALNAAAERGVVIAQSTRNGSGRLIQVKSSRPERCVLADNLPATKARVLLTLALTKTDDLAEIQRMFETY
ncbi:MAG: asparaginase [Alphaproteobacteria bacterium]|nr:asparaginase [Alphaproteobacteria bacterium]